MIEQAVADRLSEPRWLRFTPPGFDAGESRPVPDGPDPDAQGEGGDGVSRGVHRRASRTGRGVLSPASGAIHGDSAAGQRPADRGSSRIAPIRSAPASGFAACGLHGAGRSRSRAAPGQSQWRAGEVAVSRAPCRPARRCLSVYADYQYERAEIVGDDDSDMVFVNLYHEPLGAPMTYRAAKRFFDRLAKECGFPVRPHMLRHTAATNWVRAGVDLDVVQRRFGHASLASTAVYLHARDEDKRRAVEAVAAGERFR